jgi:hypothetical protein
MILGGDALGRLVLGQLPSTPTRVIEVGVSLSVVGVASGETVPVRFAGGSAFTSTPTSALGAMIVVGTSITPGVARVGHEITVNEANGTTRMVVIFGATDEELTDDALIYAMVYDDWDWWLLKQHDKAA